MPCLGTNVYGMKELFDISHYLNHSTCSHTCFTCTKDQHNDVTITRTLNGSDKYYTLSIPNHYLFFGCIVSEKQILAMLEWEPKS